MKIIDLSQPIFADCPNCPVHPAVEAKLIARHPTDGWHMELLSLASHTGSHLDAPLHKIEGGKAIDDFPLETFVGEAVMADLRHATADQPIGASLLKGALPELLSDKIVLLATGWGRRRATSNEWHFHSPYLAPDGAAWLVEQQARAVGIDHYSIGGSGDDNARTHEILLRAGMWIVEDLSFPDEIFAVPQPFQFWSLPINFRGFSGSFCRPVALLP